MKFIADAMLGRLAKWLRIIGYDTLYYPRIADSLLLRIAREEERVLLTRDTRLVKVRGIKKYLLLTHNDPFEQLKTVITTFHLCPLEMPDVHTDCISPPAGRCSICNTSLEDIPKEQAKSHVPEYVYLTSDKFLYCSGCRKFYWKGTHHEKQRKKLMEVLYN